MTSPRRRRRKTLRRNTSLSLSRYVEESTEKGVQSLIKKIERDLKPKLEKSFVSAVGPGWKVEEVSTQVIEQDPFERDRLNIYASVKPAPSNPAYEYVSEVEDGDQVRQWMQEITYGDGEVRDNDEMGPDFRYLLYLGSYPWI
jgi:hypothetical protein